MQSIVMRRARSLARRFVAGDTLAEALTAIHALEQQGIHAIVDLLGEMVTTTDQARHFQAEILRLVAALTELSYPRYISIKLTQAHAARFGPLC